MKAKPLNFLYKIGQRQPWLILVVSLLLIAVNLIGELPFSGDLKGYLAFEKFPDILTKIIHYAVFGNYESSFINFFSRLYYCIILFTWVFLIVGIIRYFGVKRSVTILKLIALLVFWQGLFDLIRLVYFAYFSPFSGIINTSYFSPLFIFVKAVLPLLLSVVLLALLSPTQTVTDENTTDFPPLNRWQRGFHYFIDRLVIWFIGYNFYLIDYFYSNQSYLWFIGVLLFLSLLVILPLLSEWLFGVTITKIITGTEVVRNDGKPISLLQAIGRAFIRIIPFGWLSVFGKTPWIDQWTGTQVRYYHHDQPLLRLHKCVQLGTGIIFLSGIWYLAIIASIVLEINPQNESLAVFFPFQILFICLLFIPFLHSSWLATVVSYYRDLRDGKQTISPSTFLQAFYCWIPILNFYYLSIYLGEITSHLEHVDSSEEENERIDTRMKQFSNVFGLITLFMGGLCIPLFINTSNKYVFIITGLITLCMMMYAFFAWNFSRVLKNTVVKSGKTSELIDDLDK